MAEANEPGTGNPSRMRRATLQFILGLLQMTGVMVGLVLLIWTGASPWTVAVVAFTAGISLSSWLLRRAASKDH